MFRNILNIGRVEELVQKFNLKVSLTPATGEINSGRRLTKSGPIQEQSTQLGVLFQPALLVFKSKKGETKHTRVQNRLL